MDETTQAMIGSVVRTIIITLGGGAAFSNDQVTAIAGAIAVLAGALWSLYQKRRAGEKLKAARAPNP